MGKNYKVLFSCAHDNHYGLSVKELLEQSTMNKSVVIDGMFGNWIDGKVWEPKQGVSFGKYSMMVQVLDVDLSNLIVLIDDIIDKVGLKGAFIIGDGKNYLLFR